MTVSIRPAIVDDCGIIYDFIQKIGHEGEFSDWYIGNIHGVEKQFFGSDKIAHAFIATKNKKPIGFVVFTYIFFGPETSKIIYLHYLYVLPDERLKGVGSSLINYLKTYAKKKNIKRIRFICENDNVKAREFYQKFNSEEYPQVLTIDLPL